MLNFLLNQKLYKRRSNMPKGFNASTIRRAILDQIVEGETGVPGAGLNPSTAKLSQGLENFRIYNDQDPDIDHVMIDGKFHRIT
jgi:hypothetical protein